MKLTSDKKRTIHQGFTLIEVLVALTLSAIALLGLAAAQVKSLQFATNSFHYTVSLIQANNTVERIWVDLCDLQQGRITYDDAYKASISPQLTGYELTLPNVFSNDFEVHVSWTDERVTDGLDNQVKINVSFPQLPSGC